MNQASLEALSKVVKDITDEALLTFPPAEDASGDLFGKIWHTVRRETYHAMAQQALLVCGNNQSDAARALGINRNTLRTWAKRSTDMTTAQQQAPSMTSTEWFGDCWIDLNCNYPASEANGFLMVRDKNGTRCVGGFEKKPNGWVAVHDCLPDDDGNDQCIIGVYPSRQLAAAALWGKRFHAVA